MFGTNPNNKIGRNNKISGGNATYNSQRSQKVYKTINLNLHGHFVIALTKSENIAHNAY